MQVTNETPMREITVQGVKLQAPAPYAEGHTLNANEAAAMNQLLAENLRNNFASIIKKGVEEGADLQAMFDAYVAEYEIGVRRTSSGEGRVSMTPVEREMKRIAEDRIRSVLKTKGLSVKQVGQDKFKEFVEKLLSSEHVDAIRTEAERRINAATEALGDLDLDAVA